jgi:hypothetical protein
MGKLWEELQALHWHLFMQNAAYFLLSLPFVFLYWFIKTMFEKIK